MDTDFAPDNLHFGKIVATVGPASESEEGITSLMNAGVDVFRLNFSHGSHEEQGKRAVHIRAQEKKVGRSVGIIADLQGPKLRVGTFADGEEVLLHAGDTFTFLLEKGLGDESQVSLPHPEIFKAAKIGMDILIDDGRLRFRVVEVRDTSLETTVVIGGLLKQRKGANIPMVELPINAVTEKDEKDLLFALTQDVDWIALSFVQRPEDVRRAKELIKGRAGIIAKIEKPSAVEHIEDIIEEVDAIMIARGDLGVEIPPEEVPSVQKHIIALCRQAAKPVIVATHMLDSMVDSPYPTRAEVSDVANAIYDGTDAVMLSAETAAGKYPAESVMMMRRIIRRTITDPKFFDVVHRLEIVGSDCSADSAAVTAYEDARKNNVAAIATSLSASDSNLAACYSRRRYNLPLFGITTDERLARQLALLWGVAGIYAEGISGFKSDSDDNATLIRIVREKGLLNNVDTVFTV